MGNIDFKIIVFQLGFKNLLNFIVFIHEDFIEK